MTDYKFPIDRSDLKVRVAKMRLYAEDMKERMNKIELELSSLYSLVESETK